MDDALKGRLWLVAVVAVLTAYRLLVIWGTELPLFYDQAYYFFWSLHPDWGYYSKPPMVAWLIGLTTSLWGTSEVAINAGATILYALSALLVYAIGRDLYSERTGIWAGIAFACMPLVGFNSLFVSTDAPLMFFWALTLWAFVRATASGAWKWWLAAGVAAGLGMLSKYTMGVLAIGLLAYLLVDREQRHWLTDIRLWVGVGLAALLLAPNLWWNLQHDFISFRHTAEISQLDQELFRPDHLAEFLAAQFGVFGPIFMGYFAWKAVRPASYRSRANRLTLFPALAMLGVIGLQALLSRAHPNWAAPAFVTASVFVCANWVEARRTRLYAGALAINLLLLSVFYHYHFIARSLGVELARGQTPYYRVLGWRELGAAISSTVARYPEAWLLSDSRRDLAYLSYYLVPPRMQVAWWGPSEGSPRNHYDLVADIAAVAADEFIFVSEKPLDDAVLASFAQQAFLGEYRVQALSDLTLQVYLYHLQGFRGYPE